MGSDQLAIASRIGGRSAMQTCSASVYSQQQPQVVIANLGRFEDSLRLESEGVTYLLEYPALGFYQPSELMDWGTKAKSLHDGAAFRRKKFFSLLLNNTTSLRDFHDVEIRDITTQIRFLNLTQLLSFWANLDKLNLRGDGTPAKHIFATTIRDSTRASFAQALISSADRSSSPTNPGGNVLQFSGSIVGNSPKAQSALLSTREPQSQFQLASRLCPIALGREALIALGVHRILSRQGILVSEHLASSPGDSTRSSPSSSDSEPEFVHRSTTATSTSSTGDIPTDSTVPTHTSHHMPNTGSDTVQTSSTEATPSSSLSPLYHTTERGIKHRCKRIHRESEGCWWRLHFDATDIIVRRVAWTPTMPVSPASCLNTSSTGTASADKDRADDDSDKSHSVSASVVAVDQGTAPLQPSAKGPAPTPRQEFPNGADLFVNVPTLTLLSTRPAHRTIYAWRNEMSVWSATCRLCECYYGCRVLKCAGGEELPAPRRKVARMADVVHELKSRLQPPTL